MWNVFQSIIFSLVLIVLSHWAFQYLKDWLTPHKKKDLVDFQIKKYKKMLEEIIQKKNDAENLFVEKSLPLTYIEDHHEPSENVFYEPSVHEDTRSEIDSVDYKSMQNELLDFIKLI